MMTIVIINYDDDDNDDAAADDDDSDDTLSNMSCGVLCRIHSAVSPTDRRTTGASLMIRGSSDQGEFYIGTVYPPVIKHGVLENGP